jgi:LssY C-terminus
VSALRMHKTAASVFVEISLPAIWKRDVRFDCRSFDPSENSSQTYLPCDYLQLQTIPFLASISSGEGRGLISLYVARRSQLINNEVHGLCAKFLTSPAGPDTLANRHAFKAVLTNATANPVEGKFGKRMVGNVFRCLVVLLALLAVSQPGNAQPCNFLPAGADFWIRLHGPVSSYSTETGATLSAALLKSPDCDGHPVFPVGIRVTGRVVSVRKVGWGLRHESARLQLTFDRIFPGSLQPLEVQTRLLEVNNAREPVKGGVIYGIRATDSPQGIINSRLIHLPTFNPYSDWGLVAYKTFFPIFPEPETYLPAGTDLHLVLTNSLALPYNLSDPPELPEYHADDAAELSEVLAPLPTRTQAKGGEDADVINLVLVGSSAQVRKAFAAAGWNPSDRVSRRSVARQFHAFLAQNSYSMAPMSTQTFEGRTADDTRQKSFDSFEKRDHLRMWELSQTWQGNNLWAVAAVREVGATLSFRHFRFVHHVDGDLDAEREVVLRDFTAEGCVEAFAMLDRPALHNLLVNSTGELFRTDRRLLVLQLRECRPTGAAHSNQLSTHEFRPGSKFFRYARMQILIFRNDIFRANSIYASYYFTRIGIGALRQRHKSDDLAASTGPFLEPNCDWICREVTFPRGASH